MLRFEYFKKAGIASFKKTWGTTTIVKSLVLSNLIPACTQSLFHELLPGIFMLTILSCLSWLLLLRVNCNRLGLEYQYMEASINTRNKSRPEWMKMRSCRANEYTFFFVFQTKTLGRSKFDSVFHPFEVDQIFTRNSWELTDEN